jgi:hypothetical protein
MTVGLKKEKNRRNIAKIESAWPDNLIWKVRRRSSVEIHCSSRRNLLKEYPKWLLNSVHKVYNLRYTHFRNWKFNNMNDSFKVSMLKIGRVQADLTGHKFSYSIENNDKS